MTEWYQQQMRIIHASLAFARGELAEMDMARFAADVAAQDYNAQHVEYGLSWDGDQKVFYFQTDESKSVPRDVLADYLPEAHQRGIHVFIYMNVHWAGKLYIAENPDWVQRKQDGSPLTGMYGGSGTSLCVNAPWRDWILKLTEEMAEKHPIDGIFLDGPCFYVGTCYCDSCKQLFRDRYGLDITEIADAQSPHWREFIEFRYDSIARFVHDVRAALQKYRPGAPLYMNANGLHSGHANGRNNRKLTRGAGHPRRRGRLYLLRAADRYAALESGGHGQVSGGAGRGQADGHLYRRGTQAVGVSPHRPRNPPQRGSDLCRRRKSVARRLL